jgi:hypothetical protein
LHYLICGGQPSGLILLHVALESEKGRQYTVQTLHGEYCFSVSNFTFHFGYE